VLVSFAEGLGATKSHAAKAGYEVDANRELIGLGASEPASSNSCRRQHSRRS